MSDLMEKSGLIAILKFTAEELFIEQLVWDGIVALNDVMAHTVVFLLPGFGL